MKKYLISVGKFIAVAGIVLMANSAIDAQPNPGPGNSGSTINTTGDGPTIPFDGGMSLMLIASGISYGAKKLKKVKPSIG